MKEDWYKNLSEKKNIKKRVCKKLVLEMFEEIKQKLIERINTKISLKNTNKERRKIWKTTEKIGLKMCWRKHEKSSKLEGVVECWSENWCEVNNVGKL